MALDIIPKRLLCVTIGSEDSIQVPLPVRSIKFPFPLNEESKRVVRNNKFLLLTHPGSTIGVLGSVVNATNDGYSWILDLELLFRARLTSKSESENGLLVAEWEIFEEKPPTPQEFSSKEFQDRVRELQRLMLKFFLRLRGEDPVQGANAPALPRGISENTLGMWVDRSADVLNYFSDREEILGFLLAILEEADVKKRLEKAIEFYSYCLQNAEELIGQDFRELKEMLTGKPTAGEAKGGDKKPASVDVSELSRRLIMGVAGEKLPQKIIKDPSKDKRDNDDGSVTALLRKRILRKED